jgi:serine phosphatase RsbU (regulator of sigma subunit)
MKTIDVWKAMSTPSLVRLALAVFLMFSVLGPLSILMESALRVVSWPFVLVQCLASGGLAGTIILLGRRRWWVTTLVIVFWTAVIVLNAGGLSFLFGDDGFRVVLGSNMGVRDARAQSAPTVVSPEQLSAIYEQRGALGVLAIALLATGYTVFIRVIRAEVQQRSRLETEVRIAREIQESLLPSAAYAGPRCSAAGAARPATEVGGDFFDIVPLPGGESAAFAIADVTGHGVGAGILGAMTKSALRSQLVHSADPAAVLGTVNAALHQLSDQKTFVTFAYAAVDGASRLVRYATAGHPPILHVRSGSVQPLRTVNVALGMRADTAFATGEIAGEPGDLFVLYTDGILETRDARAEEFGADRLSASVRKGPADPAALCASVLADLAAFARSSTFQDDVSILVIRLA